MGLTRFHRIPYLGESGFHAFNAGGNGICLAGHIVGFGQCRRPGDGEAVKTRLHGIDAPSGSIGGGK